MAKRRIKFKLGKIEISGVELEIEDDREQATSMFAALQNQLASVVQPALNKSLLGAGTIVDVPAANGQSHAAPVSRQRRKRAGGAKSSDESAGQQIAFIHDPVKYGNPTQNWTAATKAIWLLWVVEQALGKKELSAPEIANAFNRHYREFGPIKLGNLPRDLGKLRTKTTPPVGTDTNRNPQVWFLLDHGKTLAERLKSGWDGKGD